MGKKTIAVIDVGSNTIRTCVYRVKGRDSSGKGRDSNGKGRDSNGKGRDSGFKKIIDVSRAVGLSGYIDDSGALSEEGISAGCSALSNMVRVSELAASDKIIILATGAVRNCVNSQKVAKAFRKKTGYPIRVLSGESEALMSATGASWSTGVRAGLFFDLGGGSTELADVHKGKVVEVDSIPVGALSSWKREASTLLPQPEEIEAIETGFAMLAQASHVNVAGHSTVVGVGGSMRLALKAARSLRGDDSGRTLRLSDLDLILDKGIYDSESFCRMILRLKPERIHTLLPACAIARAILRSANCDKLTVSKAGLREGCLLTELSRLD